MGTCSIVEICMKGWALCHFIQQNVRHKSRVRIKVLKMQAEDII